MAIKKDLQPWLDYFKMLRTYERSGLLNLKPADGEAYVTQSAIHAMSEGDDPKQQLMKAIPETVRRIRAYAGWLQTDGADYLLRPFAVHVVKDDFPHDLLYTILLTRRRVWWRLWRKSEHIEVISYQK